MNIAKQGKILGMTKPRGGQSDPSESYDKLLQFGAMGKAFSILETITANRRPLSMTELARVTGMTKPTAHRIVNVLTELQFIERDRINRGYIEGPRLIDFAVQTLSAAAPRTLRHSILESASEEIGETLTFGALAGPEVICVDRVEAKWPLGLRFEPGSRVPAHCTSPGKLLLSLQSETSRNDILRSMKLERYTNNTITDHEALSEELKSTRSSAIGINNQEFINGVVGVAVPVVGKNGETVGALSMCAPEARISLDQMLEYVPALKRSADRLGETYELI